MLHLPLRVQPARLWPQRPGQVGLRAWSERTQGRQRLLRLLLVSAPQLGQSGLENLGQPPCPARQGPARAVWRGPAVPGPRSRRRVGEGWRVLPLLAHSQEEQQQPAGVPPDCQALVWRQPQLEPERLRLVMPEQEACLPQADLPLRLAWPPRQLGRPLALSATCNHYTLDTSTLCPEARDCPYGAGSGNRDRHRQPA
jgi:hypothetical protein